MDELEIIKKWADQVREFQFPEHSNLSKEVDQAIESCLKELGIFNGSLESIEVTETFLDILEGEFDTK